MELEKGPLLENPAWSSQVSQEDYSPTCYMRKSASRLYRTWRGKVGLSKTSDAINQLRLRKVFHLDADGSEYLRDITLSIESELEKMFQKTDNSRKCEQT